MERKKAAWEAEQQRQREAEARRLEQERILAEKKAEEQRIQEEQRAKEQRILEEQRAKEQRILEERQAKERRIQEQKRIEEERIRKQEAERKEKERKKQEEERLRKDQEAQRIGAAANAVLWKALYEKNYVQIDNMFFVMDGENGQSITVVLKKFLMLCIYWPFGQILTKVMPFIKNKPCRFSLMNRDRALGLTIPWFGLRELRRLMTCLGFIMMAGARFGQAG